MLSYLQQNVWTSAIAEPPCPWEQTSLSWHIYGQPLNRYTYYFTCFSMLPTNTQQKQ